MDAPVEDGVAGTLVAELAAGESVHAAARSLVDHTGGVRVQRPREGVLRSVASAATRSAFLAVTDDVHVGADSVGDAPARGAGLFLTTVEGDGTLYLAGHGRVDAVAVEDGDEHVVSAAHVVAFE